ncbi:DUF202 domain-containing protein [Durusdinium trenchii]|uniref:DUF202 domain-containing protein n=1 Tax=Durusdinium trenchii TaxID=1381693 RepID=A0ABP0RG65_9DINO
MSHTGVHVERQLCVRCFTTSAESRCFQLLLPVGAAVDDITCCLRDRLGLPPQFPLELPEDLSQQGELELQVPTAALLRLVPPSQAETELRPADAAPLRPAALDVPASTVLSTELAHERALMAWTRTSFATSKMLFCFGFLPIALDKRLKVSASAIMSVALVLAAVVALLVGWQRYLQVKRQGVLQARRIDIRPALQCLLLYVVLSCGCVLLKF